MPESTQATPEIRNEANELRLLFEISQILGEAPDLFDKLDDALALMGKYTGMMRGTLSLIDWKNKEVYVEAAFGLRDSEKRTGKYKVGEGITGKVIAAGKPMIVQNISKESQFLNRTGARNVLKEDVSFICVPILLQGQAVGALSADRLFADSVSLEEDMRLLQIVASLVARAVGTQREYREKHAAVVEENRRLHALVHGSFDPGKMVGSSGSMRIVIEELQQVIASNVTVLIRGESGTGKELIASIIHTNSPRSGNPFVKVNCAALPEGLIESELFGHERGAFTGAVGVRKGRFEMANSGTLFLDEVGDMTPLMQVKLLRALQEKEFERVGGTDTIRVDVRVVAATNRDLEKMVAEGTFRQDLYYRLSVLPVMLPPLRERREDITTLAAHFVDKFSAENNRQIFKISSSATSALVNYGWPGNIRELENVIQRAVILSGTSGRIDLSHLPANLRGEGAASSLKNPFASGSLDGTLAELEQRMIVHALEEERGNMARASERLGITERIMGLRMKKYNLSYKDFRLPDSF